MANEPVVKTEGLRELTRDLRKIDAEFPKRLREANKAVAERVVLPEARRRAGMSYRNVAGGMTRAGSKLTGSIRPLASQRGASIALGRASIPYGPGMEWGSTGKRRRARQFPARSGKSQGFILYPTVREKQTEIRDVYFEMLGDLIDETVGG